MSAEALKAVFGRHSCRDFTGEPLPEEDLKTLMEALRQAPSAGNMQPWRFYVVKNASVKRRLAKAAYGQDFVSDAPVVFVICADAEESATTYRDRGRTLYCLQDTAAATENLLIAATALGYGTCWVGAFDEGAARDALSLPENLRPVAMVPVGRGRIPSRGPERKPVEEIFEFVE
jgi:nitroreductase